MHIIVSEPFNRQIDNIVPIYASILPVYFLRVFSSLCYFVVVYFFDHASWLAGSQFQEQGLNPGQGTGSLANHWTTRVLPLIYLSIYLSIYLFENKCTLITEFLLYP